MFECLNSLKVSKYREAVKQFESLSGLQVDGLGQTTINGKHSNFQIIKS